ncbi:hypothetical protein [Orenia marismortui]|uniref:hypothetical protein n=1 Tax=Orenia marismortui TaxID=46469 RepID=UPI00036912D9|nr:hypothetical protein [Orenia marismortui]
MELNQLDQLLEVFSDEEVRYRVGVDEKFGKCVVINEGESRLELKGEPEIKIMIDDVWELTEHGVGELDDTFSIVEDKEKYVHIDYVDEVLRKLDDNLHKHYDYFVNKDDMVVCECLKTGKSYEFAYATQILDIGLLDSDSEDVIVYMELDMTDNPYGDEDSFTWILRSDEIFNVI